MLFVLQRVKPRSAVNANCMKPNAIKQLVLFLALLLLGCGSMHSVDEFRQLCGSHARIDVLDRPRWDLYLDALRQSYIDSGNDPRNIRIEPLSNVRMLSDLAEMDSIPANTPINNKIRLVMDGVQIATVYSYRISFSGLASRSDFECAVNFPEYYSEITR